MDGICDLLESFFGDGWMVTVSRRAQRQVSGDGAMLGPEWINTRLPALLRGPVSRYFCGCAAVFCSTAFSIADTFIQAGLL